MKFQCASCSQTIEDSSIEEGASFNCPSCNAPGKVKFIEPSCSVAETPEIVADEETGGKQVRGGTVGWQNKYKKIGVCALVGALIVVAVTSYQLFFKMSPTEKVVYGMEQLEDIMESNMKTPKEGVNELIEYFEDYGPEALELMVQTSIDFTQISGNGDREEYIDEVAEEIGEAVESLGDTHQRFIEAVSADKAAQDRLDIYAKRWEDVFDGFSSLDL